MSCKHFLKLFTASVLIGSCQLAHADWQQVAVVKNGRGENGRVVEIDAATVKRGKDEVSVSVRTHTQDTGGSIGYSCREGDIRHGKTDKKITDLLCGRESAPNPFGPHEPDWVTVEEHQTPTSESQRKFDMNSLRRRGDMVMIEDRTFGVRTETWHFDCKGYYRGTSKGEWLLLDTTDKISTVPRGFVSPERIVSNKLCAPAAN